AFKIHLRYEPVLSTSHLEVDVCRSHHIGSSGIGCWYNCLEPIPTFGVGGQDGGSLKVRVEWCRIWVAGMRVTPMSIGLPDFDFCGANRLSREVQHSPHDVEYLAVCSARPTRHSRQIGVLTQFADRIEGSEYLTRSTR